MGASLALLDEALDLARQEKIALEDGAYDDAIALAEKRGNITKMAWEALEQSERIPYQKRLLELSGVQLQLTDIARRAQDAIRKRINHSRLEKKRLRGYHLAVGQALQ